MSVRRTGQQAIAVRAPGASGGAATTGRRTPRRREGTTRHATTPTDALRVTVVSDSPVLLAGLRASLASEGLAAAAGLSSFAALRPGGGGELLLAAPAGDVDASLRAALRGDRPAVVLLREATLRVHGDELEQTTGCACLPLTSPSCDLAAALRRLARPDGPVLGTTTVVVGEGGRLTPREQDVLSALARGLTNRELAGALSVSEETVKAHLKRIFRKLGVGSRAEAISAYLVGAG